VLVTYHPDGGFAHRFGLVLAQVGAVIIVDNGSAAEALGVLRDLCTSTGSILICNGENLGVAYALNVGAERAGALGYAWALLLDQDTEVDPDMVERLLAARASCAGERVAIVGSRFRVTAGQAIEPLRLEARGALWEEVESVITSGSLLSLPAYTAIGRFRDEFFIDHVDTEFCFRARAAGYRVIETIHPLMAHAIGAPTRHTLFGATSWTTNHSADRRYYMARNNTVLLREYGTSGRGPWQWKSIVRCLRVCKRIVYFEKDKVRKIVAVAQGWWDGARGRLGPRPRR
jgi:rhamnosyltransferase